jgi:hypothetical protein
MDEKQGHDHWLRALVWMCELAAAVVVVVGLSVLELTLLVVVLTLMVE